jgi:hypothetical protein
MVFLLGEGRFLTLSEDLGLNFLRFLYGEKLFEIFFGLEGNFIRVFEEFLEVSFRIHDKSCVVSKLVVGFEFERVNF